MNSFPHKGILNTYMGGGYVFKIPHLDTNTLLNMTQMLKKLKWIDDQTVAIFIEFTTFNPFVNLFQFCLILFEIDSAGTIVNSAQFMPINLYDLNINSLLSFKSIISLIYLAFICFFIVSELKELMVKKWDYFRDLFNYFELANLAFSWAALSMYFYRLYAVNGVIKQLKQSHSSQIINLQYIVNCDVLFVYFLALCVFFASLRFIKLFRFNRRVIVFFIAFKNSIFELISFGLIFLIIWLSFVQTFYLLLNNKSIQFATFSKSMFSCFQIILGKFNPDTIINSHIFVAPFLFVGVNVVCAFVMLNLLVTILIEHFNLARNDSHLSEQDPGLFEFVKSASKKIVFFWNKKNKRDMMTYYGPLVFWESLKNDLDQILVKYKEGKTKKKIYSFIEWPLNEKSSGTFFQITKI